MSARYSLKPEADQDLDDYADYLAREATVDVALDFSPPVMNVCASRGESAHRLAISSEESYAEDASRVRVSQFERMIILYRSHANGVEILRVVHGSRNLRALFRRRGETE